MVCALSGGADSMALLCALYELKDRLNIKLYAAHLNHSVRGLDAERDYLFVKDFCEKAGIELFYKKVDVPALAKEEHLSEEEVGRRERYKLFEEAAAKLGGGVIATGHHMGDRAETVLFNLFRGSGSRGIRGIPYVRGNIVRPLMDITHEEAKEYLKRKNITWCEDKTNGECKYLRNKIRLIIIKETEKIFPDAVKKIVAASEAVGLDDEYLTQLAKKSGAFEDGCIISEKFTPLHESLKVRVIINALEEWGVCEIDREKINAVYDTVTGATGKGRDLGKNIRIEQSYGRTGVFFKEDCPQGTPIGIKSGESLETEAFGGVWSIKTVDKCDKIRDNKMMILLDAAKIDGDLEIRCRRDGDYISPMGLDGTKKLKKVFIDLKIPKEKRDKISMLVKGSEILFIPGVRKTKNYALDEGTDKILIAEYKGSCGK